MGRDELAKEAWTRVQTRALEWLRSSEDVDDQNLRMNMDPQLRVAQHHAKVTNEQLAGQSQRALAAREVEMLDRLRPRVRARTHLHDGYHMSHYERGAEDDPEGAITTSRSLKVARRSKQQLDGRRSQRRVAKKRLSTRILKLWVSEKDEGVKQGEVVKAHFWAGRSGRSEMVESAVVAQPPIGGNVLLRFRKGKLLRTVPVVWAVPMKSIGKYIAVKGNSKRLRRKELERTRRQSPCM